MITAKEIVNMCKSISCVIDEMKQTLLKIDDNKSLWNPDKVETKMIYCSNWTCKKKTKHTKYYHGDKSYWECNICGTKN